MSNSTSQHQGGFRRLQEWLEQSKLLIALVAAIVAGLTKILGAPRSIQWAVGGLLIVILVVVTVTILRTRWREWRTIPTGQEKKDTPLEILRRLSLVHKYYPDKAAFPPPFVSVRIDSRSEYYFKLSEVRDNTWIAPAIEISMGPSRGGASRQDINESLESSFNDAEATKESLKTYESAQTLTIGWKSTDERGNAMRYKRPVKIESSRVETVSDDSRRPFVQWSE